MPSRPANVSLIHRRCPGPSVAVVLAQGFVTLTPRNARSHYERDPLWVSLAWVCLDAPARAQLRSLLDRDLAEVAMDVQSDRPHIASLTSVELETQRAN